MPLPTRGRVLGGFLRLGFVRKDRTSQKDEGLRRDGVSPSYLKGAPPLVMPLLLMADHRIRATKATPTTQVEAQPMRNDIIAMQCSIDLSPWQDSVVL